VGGGGGGVGGHGVVRDVRVGFWFRVVGFGFEERCHGRLRGVGGTYRLVIFKLGWVGDSVLIVF